MDDESWLGQEVMEAEGGPGSPDRRKSKDKGLVRQLERQGEEGNKNGCHVHVL